ncbi:MAG: HEAT repeat domain-containing protein, partial [Gemmataceae bacterium]|nr:HEAT repeat domain-containing protein [Gemmataceae bacterium]
AAVEPPAAMPAKPTKPTPLVNVSVPAPLPPTPAAKPAAPARVEPVLPPTPGIPVPAPLPPAKPPAAETAPAIPVPSAPAVPVPLPSIPSAPGGGQSLKGRPAGGVVPAGYTPADAARMEEIQPHAVALKTAVAPSVRLLAAKALAGCRHASSDAVKGLLLDAAKGDPCPAVRADCIGYLCDLGCFTPAFAEVVKAACDDPSDEVKAAAKSATARMTRK